MPRPSFLAFPVLVAALLAALLASAGPAAPSASARGGDSPAPPTQEDRSGADQDEYYIPESFYDPVSQVYVSYVVGDRWPSEGWYSTEGAASVTVTTSPDRGTWVLDYSLEATGSEAPDTFEVDTGECMFPERDSLRTVTVSITNDADETGRYVRALEVKVLLVDDGYRGHAGDEISVGGEPSVSRLPDGGTTVVELFDRDGDGNPDHNSGGSVTNLKRWRVVVMRSDRRDRVSMPGSRAYVVHDEIVRLPRCDMARAERGCTTTSVALLGRAVHAGPATWRYRVTLVEDGADPRRTTYEVSAGSVQRVSLRRGRHDPDARIRVEFFHPNGTYVYSGGKPTHWAREVVGRAWRRC